MLKYVVGASSQRTRASNASGTQAIKLHLVTKAAYKQAIKSLPKATQTWLLAIGFEAKPGQVALVAGKGGALNEVFAGVELDSPWGAAQLPKALPSGRYEVAGALADDQADALVLGWLLGTYQFTRYKKRNQRFSVLVAPPNADLATQRVLAKAIALGRDLITTPAEDMSPPALAAEAQRVFEAQGGRCREIVGRDLLEQNFPVIFAVGRASQHEPRLVDACWGDPRHPKVTLVGKGVCFDTGGLDLKPGRSMKLMKKDMGGAATALATAQAVMELRLPVRLRLLIPAVENSVSGNAIRPLDVLTSRKGLTIEVGDTDAEGRLVLSDALVEADAETPALLIDIATLTGAARVALGASLPALFASDDEFAEALLAAGEAVSDPLWRLPLHRPYRRMLDSKVADLSNIGGDGYGGAITAALFLQEFVSPRTPWLHIDTMAYNLESQPGRPAGGEVFALRAIVEMLRRRYAS